MIVKNGRLYLWYNKISDKELIIKVGSGSGSSEFLEIDQTNLVYEHHNALITVTTEKGYEQWLSNPDADVWTSTIPNITSYISDDDRKIIIYVKIKANDAFELGEMGLFAKEPAAIYDDWVSTEVSTQDEGTVPTITGTEGDMIYDTINSKLYTFTEGSWDNGITPPFVEPDKPWETGDYWFDNVNFIYHLYTLDVPHNAFHVMISRNLMIKQFVSTSETKIIKYTINI